MVTAGLTTSVPPYLLPLDSPLASLTRSGCCGSSNPFPFLATIHQLWSSQLVGGMGR
jgi:hypothetical protein